MPDYQSEILWRNMKPVISPINHARLHLEYCHSKIFNPYSYVFTSFSTSFFFVSSVCSLSLLPCCAASALASFWYDTNSFDILSMYAVQSHILTSPYTCPQQYCNDRQKTILLRITFYVSGLKWQRNHKTISTMTILLSIISLFVNLWKVCSDLPKAHIAIIA